MREADHDPVQQQRSDNQRHQQAEGLFRQQIVDQHHQRGNRPGKEQRVHRHAATADAGEEFRRVTLHGETKQHAAVGVNAAVIDRQRRHQNDEVQRRSHHVAVQIVENHHERAAVGFHFYPRVERQQHHQRADVEQQDTVHHLVNRFRNAFVRVMRFRGGDANQLQPAEGEHDHCQREDQPFPAGRQEAAVLPEVIDRGALAAVAGEQQPQAEADHADNRQHLDQRKPELGFAIQTDVDEVNGVDNDEEGRRPDPRGHVRQPVLHVDAGGGQLRHPNQHEHHPVVPAGEEACERTPVFIGKMREGA